MEFYSNNQNSISNLPKNLVESVSKVLSEGTKTSDQFITEKSEVIEVGDVEVRFFFNLSKNQLINIGNKSKGNVVRGIVINEKTVYWWDGWDANHNTIIRKFRVPLKYSQFPLHMEKQGNKWVFETRNFMHENPRIMNHPGIKPLKLTPVIDRHGDAHALVFGE
jgi:hypothetical protein